MGKVALNLLPKPDLVFLVNLPEEVAYQRKDDIPSVDYLKKKRAVYLRMEKKYKMTIIDGSKELADLKNVILPEAMKLA
jgi:dTMP kinase